MHSNVSDHQIDTDCYTLRMLCINLMVTKNQKPVKDTQTKKIKNLRLNTKKSSFRKRSRKGRIRNYKNKQKTINKM